jgi:hypothetical protein
VIQGRVAMPQSRLVRAHRTFAPELSEARRRGSACSKESSGHRVSYPVQILMGNDPYWAGGSASPFFFKVAGGSKDWWFPGQDKGQNGVAALR